MELDVMRCLLEVRTRLQESTDPAGEPGDLQAVERVLPDTDWFELEEVREFAPGSRGRLVDGPEPQLEF